MSESEKRTEKRNGKDSVRAMEMKNGKYFGSYNKLHAHEDINILHAIILTKPNGRRFI